MSKAKRKTFFMCRCDGDKRWFLAADKRYSDESRPATDKDLNPKAIAALLDQDAENGNDHAFCGVHESLRRLLSKRLDSVDLDEVMLMLLQRRGLHGMACDRVWRD